ncbi:uncharacterized protein LOC129770497 [Toxorhynchites rutilus septentrionalis]|uniref:uncharacterized protein LOC129770497 n=1 Tax=Toxorhynchites rutilus septentrionalis TaxID=329112 RepID=UPI00247AF376|nr:uncharacterized protein LOC129770497 [Toxorhynchites rutilus septentrionalis]
MNKRQEIPMRHLFDGSDLNVYDRKIANLSAGAPGPDLLADCCEMFRVATEHRMKYELENNSYLFQYGPSIGTTEFRETLAGFLSKGYQSEVNKSDLVLTSGATHGLHLILSTLLDLSGYIFVDEVTYMIALEVFGQFSSMKVIPVPLNTDGPNIKILTSLIEQFRFEPKDGKMFWGVYYTIPTFHNPTGILFSEEINKQLISLARSREILIACDDVYNLLCYKNSDLNPSVKQSPKRLFAYDIEDIDCDNWKGNIISNGSFSKILSPGIRLGWLECPPRCVAVFRTSGVLKSGGAANNYTAGVVSSMIQLGLAERHLRKLSENYSERLEAACEVLKAELPRGCTFLQPTGGYFIWIRFPDGIDCDDFNQYSMKHFGVMAIGGSRFSPLKQQLNFLRLTFAFHQPEYLHNSVSKMCAAMKAYLSEKSHL